MVAPNKNTHTIVFGDGACSGNPGPGGWGAVIQTIKGEVWELGGGSPSTTNNQMELIALIEALSTLNDHDEKILVLSDSVYVLKGITEWIFGWRKRNWRTAEGTPVANAELWDRLSEVVSGFSKSQLSWGYVPGHKGVPGNERVDEIAVGFSKSQSVWLYRGLVQNYSYDLWSLPQSIAIPDLNFNNREKKVAHSYLSYVNGIAKRHSSWAECEAQVKGRSGAKFKKAMSKEDEFLILADWGVDPSAVK